MENNVEIITNGEIEFPDMPPTEGRKNPVTLLETLIDIMNEEEE